jgi:hypothetical protein
VHGLDLPGQLDIGALARRRPAQVLVKAARETFSSSHARLTLRLHTFSASMNGYTLTGSPSRRKPWPA